MARDNEKITSVEGDWTMISDGATATITFQVRRGTAEIRATTSATKPASTLGGWVYSAGAREGEIARAVSDLAAAVSSTGYVWARGDADIQVDHA